MMKKLDFEEQQKENCEPYIQDLSNALKYFQASPWGLGLCNLQLGRLYMSPATSDFDKARERLTLALKLFIEVGHLRGIQMTQQRFYFLLDTNAAE